MSGMGGLVSTFKLTYLGVGQQPACLVMNEMGWVVEGEARSLGLGAFNLHLDMRPEQIRRSWT